MSQPPALTRQSTPSRCPICREDIVNDLARLMPCKHELHLECLRYLQNDKNLKETCPYGDNVKFNEIRFDFTAEGTYSSEYYGIPPPASVLRGPDIRPEEEIRSDMSDAEVQIRMKLRELRYKPNMSYEILLTFPPVYAIEGRSVVHAMRYFSLSIHIERTAPTPGTNIKYFKRLLLENFKRTPLTRTHLTRSVEIRAFQIPMRPSEPNSSFAALEDKAQYKQGEDNWGTYSPELVEKAREEIAQWRRKHAPFADSDTNIAFEEPQTFLMVDRTGLVCRVSRDHRYNGHDGREGYSKINPEVSDQLPYQALKHSLYLDEQLLTEFITDEEKIEIDTNKVLSLHPVEERHRKVSEAREEIRGALYILERIFTPLEKASPDNYNITPRLDPAITGIIVGASPEDCESCGGVHNECLFPYIGSPATWKGYVKVVLSGRELGIPNSDHELELSRVDSVFLAVAEDTQEEPGLKLSIEEVGIIIHGPGYGYATS